MSFTVLNRHHLKTAWPAGSVYIGRGTAFGNPYIVGEHGTREECVAAFRDRALRRLVDGDPAWVTALAGLHDGMSLVCSCAPAPCHASGVIAAWEQLQAKGLPYAPTRFTYAGIGSRNTPPTMRSRMIRIAERMMERGYVLRSGGADGADSAFETGAGDDKEIYLPFKGFRGNSSPLFAPTPAAFDVAAAVHPFWSKLSPNERLFHARNSHQILGESLRLPVELVIAWTPDGAECEADRTRETGGTGQAIALASRWGIPVFNLARDNALDRIAIHLEALGERDARRLVA